MEFPELGVVPFEAPSEDLKPFMRRKFLTIARGVSSYKDGVIHRELIVEECKKIAQEFPDRQKEVEKSLIKLWEFILMCNKNSSTITEEEMSDLWMKRVYADADTRKKHMETVKELMEYYFTVVDTNSDGVISYEEYSKRTSTINEEGLKASFDLFDANKDGYISQDEFIFAVLTFHWVSGPDHKYSYLLGPIVEGQ